MEFLFGVFFLTLFLIALFKHSFFVWILPIFVLCYPHNSSLLNIGGVGLDKLLIFLGVIKYFNKNSYTYLQRKWLRILFYLFFLQIFSNFFGYFIDDFENFNQELYLKGLVITIYNLVLIFLYIKVIAGERLDKIIDSLVLACVLQGLFALLLYYNFSLFYFLYSSSEHLVSGATTLRAVGTTKGPWELGGLLSFGYILLLYRITNGINSKKKLLVYFLGLVIIIAALIMSMSRASWLFVFICSSILLVINFRKMISFILPVFIILSLFFISYLESFIEIINHRVLYTFKFNSGKLDNSSQARIDLWDYFYQNFEIAYIFTGYGWQNLIAKFGTSTHNSFLSLFISNGIFGYVLYYNYFKVLFKEYFRSNAKEYIPFVVIVIGFFFYSLTTDAFFTQSVVYMLNFIGCIILCAKSSKVKNI